MKQDVIPPDIFALLEQGEARCKAEGLAFVAACCPPGAKHYIGCQEGAESDRNRLAEALLFDQRKDPL
jgi:hypothetical protein